MASANRLFGTDGRLRRCRSMQQLRTSPFRSGSLLGRTRGADQQNLLQTSCWPTLWLQRQSRYQEHVNARRSREGRPTVGLNISHSFYYNVYQG